MLGGLKLLLDGFRLFSDGDDRRLPSILTKSRDAQASVSSALATRYSVHYTNFCADWMAPSQISFAESPNLSRIICTKASSQF